MLQWSPCDTLKHVKICSYLQSPLLAATTIPCQTQGYTHWISLEQLTINTW